MKLAISSLILIFLAACNPVTQAKKTDFVPEASFSGECPGSLVSDHDYLMARLVEIKSNYKKYLNLKLADAIESGEPSQIKSHAGEISGSKKAIQSFWSDHSSEIGCHYRDANLEKIVTIDQDYLMTRIDSLNDEFDQIDEDHKVAIEKYDETIKMITKLAEEDPSLDSQEKKSSYIASRRRDIADFLRH